MHSLDDVGLDWPTKADVLIKSSNSCLTAAEKARKALVQICNPQTYYSMNSAELFEGASPLPAMSLTRTAVQSADRRVSCAEAKALKGDHGQLLTGVKFFDVPIPNKSTSTPNLWSDAFINGLTSYRGDRDPSVGPSLRRYCNLPVSIVRMRRFLQFRLGSHGLPVAVGRLSGSDQLDRAARVGTYCGGRIVVMRCT